MPLHCKHPPQDDIMGNRNGTTRPKAPRLLASALDGHWSFAAAIAAGSAVVGGLVLPLTLGRSAALKPLIAALEPLWWLVAIVFGAIALWRLGDARLSGEDEWRALLRQGQADGPRPAGDLPAPAAWTLEELRRLEPARFQAVCLALYREQGIDARCAAGGAGDDGIRLFQDPAHPDRCTTLVHCKARGKPVGVGPIRALQAAVAREPAGSGVLVAPGGFSAEGRSHASAAGLDLVDGPALLAMIGQLPAERAQHLLALATAGDGHSPSCPECGAQMVARGDARGGFWGCATAPACGGTRPLGAALEG